MTAQESRTWEDLNFRKKMVEFVYEDSRFDGISEFLASIRLCWSFTIETACAGHGFIFFNPDWWDTLPEETHKTVLYHEAQHLILRHLERGENCHPYVHNIAADHVINLDATAEGFTHEGWNWVCDPQYTGMSTEEVYALLMGNDPYEKLDFDFDAHVSREQIEEMIEEMLEKDDDDVTLEEQIEKERIKVKLLQQGVGEAEGNIGLEFGIKTKNEMIIGATWEQILEPYIDEPSDEKKRSFARPSRRNQFGSRLIMPGRTRRKIAANRLKHLVYLLDVSGSVSVQQGKQFNNSAQTVKQLLNPELMTVMFFDTKVRHVQTFTDKEPYSRIKVRAGGGTNLEPVYRRLEQLKPEAVVAFTDLMVGIPPEPEWEMTWICPEKSNSIPDNLYGRVFLIPEESKANV